MKRRHRTINIKRALITRTNQRLPHHHNNKRMHTTTSRELVGRGANEASSTLSLSLTLLSAAHPILHSIECAYISRRCCAPLLVQLHPLRLRHLNSASKVDNLFHLTYRREIKLTRNRKRKKEE